jgi:hypothetical protein
MWKALDVDLLHRTFVFPGFISVGPDRRVSRWSPARGRSMIAGVRSVDGGRR